MKKLLLLAAMGLLPYLGWSQSNTALPADTATYTPAETYCVVTPSRNIFGEKVSFDVDYGLVADPADDTTLRDSKGKKIKFNSLAQGLNYMAKQGWVFVNTLRYGPTDDSRYLFRRKVNNMPPPPVSQ